MAVFSALPARLASGKGLWLSAEVSWPGKRVCFHLSSVICNLSPYSLLWLGTAAAEQAFKFFLEFAHVLEVAVDGGETDVGDGVNAF
jgi:hypothetical protein